MSRYPAAAVAATSAAVARLRSGDTELMSITSCPCTRCGASASTASRLWSAVTALTIQSAADQPRRRLRHRHRPLRHRGAHRGRLRPLQQYVVGDEPQPGIRLRQAGDERPRRLAEADEPDPHFANTTVFWPFNSTRSSRCQRTARASTRRSMSRPLRTRSSGVSAWVTCSTSWAMIGPSSRSPVT